MSKTINFTVELTIDGVLNASLSVPFTAFTL